MPRPRGLRVDVSQASDELRDAPTGADPLFVEPVTQGVILEEERQEDDRCEHERQERLEHVELREVRVRPRQREEIAASPCGPEVEAGSVIGLPRGKGRAPPAHRLEAFERSRSPRAREVDQPDVRMFTGSEE